MPNKSPLAERIENITFETVPETDIDPRLVGLVAMPMGAKASYHRAVNSDQLVMPRYAYPFNTIEMDEHGRDLLV